MKWIHLLFMLLMSVSAAGQLVEIGVSAGGSFYQGDLSPSQLSDQIKHIHPAVGIFNRFAPASPVSATLGMTYGVLSGDNTPDILDSGGGDDPDAPSIPLNFNAKLVELYGVLEWNLMRFYPGRGTTEITPYLYAGAGLFHFQPRAFYNNSWYASYFYKTEGQGLPGEEDPYSITQIAIPFGLGLKSNIGDHWGLGFQFGGRKLFTDYVDDVGGTLVNYERLMNTRGGIAAFLSNPTIDPDTDPTNVEYRRGDDDLDWYYISTFSIFYRFGGASIRGGGGSRAKADCYKF